MLPDHVGLSGKTCPIHNLAIFFAKDHRAGKTATWRPKGPNLLGHVSKKDGSDRPCQILFSNCAKAI